MFPVDTIKTRMQALAAPGSGVSGTVSRAMSSIIRKEGFIGLYSGVGAVAVGAGPSHGIYFVVYEYMKSFLGATDDEHRPLETSAAAAAATVVADAFMTPLDVVKQRLIKYFGYNETSATDVLNYVASIFARGDAKTEE